MSEFPKVALHDLARLSPPERQQLLLELGGQARVDPLVARLRHQDVAFRAL